MSTIITPSEDQINIVITDDAVNVNVTSEPVVVNVTEEIIQVSPISGAYPLPTTVYSVFGRTGSVVAQEGDYDLGKLSDVVLLDLANNDVLSYNGTNWVNEPMDLSGYVPYTGATTNVDLGNKKLTTTNNVTANNLIGGTAAKLGGATVGGVLVSGVLSMYVASGYVLVDTMANIYPNGSNNLTLAFGQTNEVYKYVALNATNITNDLEVVYTLPDFSGTLALLEAPQVFTEINSFANNTIFNLEAQFSIGHYLVKGGTPSGFAVGQVNVYSETSTNNIVFRDPSSKAKLVFNNSTQTYTFPAASGTIALTSDIPSLTGYVTIATDQTITSSKTFSNPIIGDYGILLKNLSQPTPSAGYIGMGSNGAGVTISIRNVSTVYNNQLLFPTTASNNYQFPNATGTIALTSDIPSLTGYVTLATAQTITGSKTFSANPIITSLASASIKINSAADSSSSVAFTSDNANVGIISVNAVNFSFRNYVSTQFRFVDGSMANGGILSMPTASLETYTFPDASGTLALTSDIPSTSTFVPYTGATTNVDLGVYSLTANALIKNGGVDTQFLKADGSVDNNVYLTANDLPSTLSLYATTAASAISGYTKLVTTIDDPDYNTTAVDVSTGTITTANQFIAALVSPANLINGNPGVFNVSTYGNIKRVSGSGTAEFYFKIYKRTSAGVETLVGTSSNTLPVTSSIYTEFFSTALWNDGTFGVTDTIVLKYYATRIIGGSNPVYNFQFGGTSPVRTIVPIPTAVIPNIYLAQLADVENVAPLNNEILYYNSTSTLWEHTTIAWLLGYTPANDASVVPYTGATSAVTLGAYSLTAASLIKSGGTSAQILAADGSVITAGTNITISGGTISASGGGGGGGADIGIVYMGSLKALNFLSIY